jgi:hypothetical protein
MNVWELLSMAPFPPSIAAWGHAVAVTILRGDKVYLAGCGTVDLGTLPPSLIPDRAVVLALDPHTHSVMTKNKQMRPRGSHSSCQKLVLQIECARAALQ